jgi:carotenoid 1,2-hydratase
VTAPIGFDRDVPEGGYAWWYVDAISDDGTQALTLIAFIGSVFSPYYARAIRRFRGDPTHFAAINLALYRQSDGIWTMTERRRRHLSRGADTLAIGPSRLDWDGSRLTAALDEIAVPLPRRVRGRIRVMARRVEDAEYALDPRGGHVWRPIAPCARIEVAFERPALRWSGHAYLDHNRGDAPLGHDFRAWTWSRAATDDGAVVFYDAARRDGGETALALRFSRRAPPNVLTAPPFALLRPTLWRLRRRARADAETTPRLVRTLEDAPFYARSRLDATLDGLRVEAVHETLDLDRFANPLVQQMLKFRMLRAPW